MRELGTFLKHVVSEDRVFELAAGIILPFLRINLAHRQAQHGEYESEMQEKIESGIKACLIGAVPCSLRFVRCLKTNSCFLNSCFCFVKPVTSRRFEASWPEASMHERLRSMRLC